MRNCTKIAVATALTLPSVAVNADTQTIATNVTFTEDATVTVDKVIKPGTFVKANSTRPMTANESL